jgi:hypothetical protein
VGLAEDRTGAEGEVGACSDSVSGPHLSRAVHHGSLREDCPAFRRHQWSPSKESPPALTFTSHGGYAALGGRSHRGEAYVLFAIIGLGPAEVLVLGVLVGTIYAAFSSLTTKLVIQKVAAHESPAGESPPVIELVGRQQGFLSFLLMLVGISPITDFRVTAEEVCCNSTSLFGRRNQAVPLRSISSVAAGVQKPVGYLFVAFCFVVVGFFGGLGVLWNEGLNKFLASTLVCGAFAAVFGWLYAINKTFFVSIHAQGGPPILLAFKPNVIEGVPLNLDRALQVVKIIRDRVVASVPSASLAQPVLAGHVTSFAGVGQNGHQVMTAVSEAPEASPQVVSDFEFTSFSDVFSAQSPETLLQEARGLIKQGKRQEAVGILRDIVMRFPTSCQAGVAKSTLAKARITV